LRWNEITTREPVLQAIEEFDRVGRTEFLEKYGFRASTHLYVKHEGRRYDIKALASATHGYADPAAAPLTNNAFSSGKPLVDLFRRLGFEVETDSDRSMLDHAATLRDALQEILAGYLEAKGTKIGKASPMWKAMDRAQAALTELAREYPHIVVKSAVGKGNWATVPWIALLDRRLTDSTQHGAYLVYLFRADMTGVYATFNQGVTELRNSLGWNAAKKQLFEVARNQRTRFGDRLRPAFTSADGIDLRVATGLGSEYEASTIAWRLYETGALPSAQELMDDLYRLLDVYDEFAAIPEDSEASEARPVEDPAWSTIAVTRALRAKGFTFESWQVAAFVHALRTKPFVILAGISGTGKSKLPLLIGELTDARVHLIPVRPDWSDSADLVGYTNLQGSFVPGRLLEIAKAASDEPTVQHIVVLDEMNLARVEQYFAEVLSLIEDREWSAAGPRSRAPLAPSAPAPWGAVRLPANVSVVGTVNMDETTHGFSRKVLDRAFTLEMSAVDLSDWRTSRTTGAADRVPWSLRRWQPVALRPGDIASPNDYEHDRVEQVILELTEVNQALSQAQLQVGYRVRDEIAMFLIHAGADPDGFGSVDPLDLALSMKILPRIQGGSSAIRAILQRLLAWSYDGKRESDTERNERLVGDWAAAGRPDNFEGARYPRTAARLCLMWERLQSDGFTSYWL
jgi:hypothetical protein